MHSNVTIKNVSWLHFGWATLYIRYRAKSTFMQINLENNYGEFRKEVLCYF